MLQLEGYAKERWRGRVGVDSLIQRKRVLEQGEFHWVVIIPSHKILTLFMHSGAVGSRGRGWVRVTAAGKKYKAIHMP